MKNYGKGDKGRFTGYFGTVPGRQMKIDRMIGILSILLQQEKVTAPYLAEKFEVSRRTINRDIEALCMAGIPLVTEQGAMLMYGKEASNRKQEIDSQHHTIPNQRNQRPKDKHRGNVYNLLFRHGKVRSQNMEKLKCSFPTFCKQTFPQLHKTASYAHSHSAYVGEILRITYNMYNLNFFQIYH